MKLDTHTTELIAIAASYTANCLTCIEYHIGKARECGVDAQEIADAIEIGRMVRKGANSKTDKFVATHDRSGLAAAPAQDPAGCGCQA